MSNDAASSYWDERKSLVYYQIVRILVDELSTGAGSMLDVGSGNCPYLEWFPNVERRVSLDMRSPYSGGGVEPIKSDFLAWVPESRFDVVTCLQVLEHVPDAADFAQKLLSVGKVLVVSVPYKWPEGHTKSHVHDPVDESKLLSWFGREPNYSYICQEIKADVRRIVQVYDVFPEKWKALNQRRGILRKKA